jgi:SSS family solute:Na+ symporter
MWKGIGHFADNPMGVHWTGIVFGLGFVISFGYWTTDFLVVQRVLAANSLRSARIAPSHRLLLQDGRALHRDSARPAGAGSAAQSRRQPDASGRRRCSSAHPGAGLHSYNEVLPLMLVRYCSPGLLGLGITALIAGFMSGMAGNVSAFAAVWTYDIYQPLINKKAPDSHYVAVGRWATILGVVVSIGAAYLVMMRQGHHGLRAGALQLLHCAAARVDPHGHVLEARTKGGGFWGLLIGTLTSIGLWAWVH